MVASRLAAVPYTFGSHPVAAVQYTFGSHPVAAVQYTFGSQLVAAVQYTFGSHPVGISTLHIYTQTIHKTTQNNNTQNNTTVLEEWWPCSICGGFTLAFALHLRNKHGKTSVRVVEERQLAR